MLSKDTTIINGMVRTKDSVKTKDADNRYSTLCSNCANYYLNCGGQQLKQRCQEVMKNAVMANALGSLPLVLDL